MDLKTISATLALLGSGLALSACDSKNDKAKADPKADGAPAKEVAPAKGEADAKTDAKADAKAEMACAEGMCAPGACGGKKDDAAAAKAGEPDDSDEPDDGDVEDKT
jgi:hypothetical protein